MYDAEGGDMPKKAVLYDDPICVRLTKKAKFDLADLCNKNYIDQADMIRRAVDCLLYNPHCQAREKWSRGGAAWITDKKR